MKNTVQPLACFTVECPPAALFDGLFTSSDDGHLGFGFSAKTISPCTREALNTGADFRDYILEGFVRYRLQLVETDAGCVLGVSAYDSNRVDAIIPAIKHYLRAAGITATETSGTDPSLQQI